MEQRGRFGGGGGVDEGRLPGKLDTFHHRHVGQFLSYTFLVIVRCRNKR